MGSTPPLYDNDGKIRGYQARWRDRDGKDRKKNFLRANGMRKKDAEEHVQDMEREARLPAPEPEPDDPIDREVTNAELVWEYIELRGPHLADRGVRSMISRYKNQILPTEFGARTAYDTPWSAVQKWADETRANYSKSTTDGCLTMLRSAYKLAVRDKRIPESPAAHKIDVADEEDDETFVPLEVDEVVRILAELPPLMRIIAATQAHTGARVHEVLGLQDGDVDLANQVIYFKQQLDSRAKTRAKLKTKSSRREVTIGRRLTDDLRVWMDDHPPTADGFLFLDQSGLPVGYDVYRWALSKAAERAIGRDVQSHGFRHHHASVLIEANVPLLAIAKRLGHASVKQIEKTYGHLLKKVADITRAAVDKAWEGH